jgi:hypothetical protein
MLYSACTIVVTMKASLADRRNHKTRLIAYTRIGHAMSTT